jgi:hypothetical protein
MIIVRPESSGLKQILDRILDKGVVIDATLGAALFDLDLLALHAHAVLSSFKTALETGLDFPDGTNLETPAWRALVSKQPCPACGMESGGLEEEGCPWCGWNLKT